MNGVFGQMARNLLIPHIPEPEFPFVPAFKAHKKPVEVQSGYRHPNRPFNSLSHS